MKDMNTTDWTAFGFYAEPKWVQNTNVVIKALQLQSFITFEALFTGGWKDSNRRVFQTLLTSGFLLL